MANHTEPLSGGLVTAKDPSLLAPGELQQTDNLYYKPASPSLHKAPGRSKVNGVALNAGAEGLRYCGFDGTVDRLVVLEGNYQSVKSLKIAAVGTGHFTTLASNVSGSTLEAIHYNNRHVLLLGGSDNRVLLSSGLTRRHGMKPVVAAPNAVRTVGGGTFPVTAGIYEYWVTEVYKTATEEIESAFIGTPFTVPAVGASDYVTLFMPGQTNGEATHWRIYRSIKKEAAGDVAYPNGFRIGEIPITTTSFTDGLTITTSYSLATIATTDTSIRGHITQTWNKAGFNERPVIVTQPITSTVIWTSPSAALSSTDAGAVATSGLLSPPTATSIVGSQLMLDTFGLSGIGAPITNVDIEVTGKLNPSGSTLVVQLSWDGGVNWTTQATVPLTGVSATYVLGGLWNRTWSPSDFSDANFKVLLTTLYANSGTGKVDVDYVRARVTHSGTTGDQSVFFRDIQIVLGGTAVKIAAAGAPPVATTGDIFQDSLVLNDVSNPTQVTYSMPGDIDAFPAVYLLKTDTKDKDTVTNIKSLGSVCLIGLSSQVWRVNYLPQEEDAEFNRGRCIEVVDTDHGMAGTHAACKFTLAGQTMVGYASSSGLRMTNGFQAHTMTDDLDWEATVDVSRLSSCVLINDSKNHQLRLYYSVSGATGLSRCLFLSYHPSHLKDGKLKVSGPAHVSMFAATTGPNLVYTSDTAGFVYLENQGSVDDSGVGIAPILRTREMYLAGHGNEWELQDTFIHHQSDGGGTYQVSYEVAKSNTDVRTTNPKSFATLRRGLSKVGAFESGEGISIKIVGTDDELPASFDYLVLNGNNMGLSDPLTR